MFDARLRPLIDPPLNRVGNWIANAGLSANTLTWAGFGSGFLAFVSISMGAYWIGLGLVIINRLLDGLDGAVARATQKTDLGGYLDIVLDFFFYGLVPLGFAIADRDVNALPAALLLFSFFANGSTFLAFAIMAEKRGLSTSAQGSKSLYYFGGLAEGAETIGLFVLICLWPSAFAVLAYIYAGLCIVSASARVAMATQAFKQQE
ncbi:MAG: CDP-alcohol phosphatidyltransferase family protein [Rhodobacteraceae bacterium]|nr:CDP-alcohol phosphatidyltransferase family protein [Paracoccaceae bacterium]